MNSTLSPLESKTRASTGKPGETEVTPPIPREEKSLSKPVTDTRSQPGTGPCLSKRALLIALLITAMIPACGDSGGNQPHLFDGGSGADGGSFADGGPPSDGGSGADGGSFADGGPPSDGGPAGDGGLERDGGQERAIWCATQWPPATATAAGFPTERLFARVWIDGVTPTGGSTPSLKVELGSGPAGNPPGGPGWTWLPADYNSRCDGCGSNDEFMKTLLPQSAGVFLWSARVRYGSRPFLYCDRTDGNRQGSHDGWAAADAPLLTVSAPGGLKVLSLNLRCLLDNWDARLPVIADALAQADPDLLGFQEVCAKPGGRDNLAELLSALEGRTSRTYSVSRTTTHRSWEIYDEGLAIATPHRIALTGTAALPVGSFPRKLLLTRVITPQGPVTLATTHLDHLNSAIRNSQATAAVQALSNFAGGREAIFLTGDLNEGPEGGVHGVLSSAGFADLWQVLHPGESGYTFPAIGPTSRIDYVWLKAGSSQFAPSVISTILETVVGGLTGSDHLGLLATASR